MPYYLPSSATPVLDMFHKLGMPSSERGLGAVELRKLPVKRFAPKGVHGRGVNRIQIGCGCCLVGEICMELRPSHGRILRPHLVFVLGGLARLAVASSADAWLCVSLCSLPLVCSWASKLGGSGRSLMFRVVWLFGQIQHAMWMRGGA